MARPSRVGSLTSRRPTEPPDRVITARGLDAEPRNKGTHLVETFARLLVEPLTNVYATEAPVRPSGARLSAETLEAFRATRDQDVIVITHSPVDVDALASALAMAAVLEKLQQGQGGSGSVRVFIPGRIPLRVDQWVDPALRHLIVSDYEALGLEGRTKPFTTVLVDAADRHQLADGARLLDHPAHAVMIGVDHHGVELNRAALGVAPSVKVVNGNDSEATAATEIVLDIADAVEVRVEEKLVELRGLIEMCIWALRTDDPSMEYPRGIGLARWLVHEMLGADTRGIDAKARSALPADALAILTGDPVPELRQLLIAHGVLKPGEETGVIGLDEATIISSPRSVRGGALFAARRDIHGPAARRTDPSDCIGILMDLLDAFATMRSLSVLLLQNEDGVRVCVRSPKQRVAKDLVDLLPGTDGGGSPRKAAKTLHKMTLEQAEQLVRAKVEEMFEPLGV